ncbi:MAG: sulfatase [Kiritimatiellaceae bacterium]|nr:sulfatase [Kiritimatiellaceae bacterium]
MKKKLAGRKNLIIILADQLRRQALACYGDPNVSTPNIDRLAAKGVRFNAACSTYPVCVPFRFSLMTGEYGHARNVPTIDWQMDPGERSLADPFNEAGYHTVYLGKWHLDGIPYPHFDVPVPRERQARWQKWYGFELCNNHFNSFYFEDDDPEKKLIEGYQTDGFFDLTIHHLAEKRPKDKPFCCLLSVEPPHFPYEAPEEDIARWRDRELILPATFQQRENYFCPESTWDPPIEADVNDRLRRLRIYYAMIENLDRNVGKLLDWLDHEGLAENTIVSLIADHGEMGGAHGFPTAMKESSFEEAIAIPFIVCDPSVAQTKVIDDVLCTEDFFPTFCGIAGVKVPAGLPGLDCSPLIRGESRGLERESVLIEMVEERRPKGTFYGHSMRGLRGPRYKYTVLRGPQGGVYSPGHIAPWQLFDREKDSLEQRNLLLDPEQDTAELAQRLHCELVEKLEAANDGEWIKGCALPFA